MAEEEFGVLETIRELRVKEPFIPFRIVMTSGEGYVIENSELLAIGRSQLVYCLPRSDKTAHLRINQIAAVEELSAPNGKKTTRKRSK